MTPHVLTDSSSDPMKVGKGGEGGGFQVNNAEFVAALFPFLPEGAFAATCSNSGDPGLDTAQYFNRKKVVLEDTAESGTLDDDRPWTVGEDVENLGESMVATLSPMDFERERAS